MQELTLHRLDTGHEGTFGQLQLPNGKLLCTAELPWKDNATGKSCVPPGRYLVRWQPSPRHGFCYHVTGVPGRSDIEIHSANFAGDADLGWEAQLLGCIALGTAVGHLMNTHDDYQRAVLHSVDAVTELSQALKNQDFYLTIEDIHHADAPAPVEPESAPAVDHTAPVEVAESAEPGHVEQD